MQAEGARRRLVKCIHDLERLEKGKKDAADALKERFQEAKGAGFDPETLKVVLRLRKLTPDQRRERRALEAIYMAALGMLDGDALPESARRHFESAPPPPVPDPSEPTLEPEDAIAPPVAQPPAPAEPQLPLKTPDEARLEGEAAAAAGKRIYDNPYSAGDPCRAAWDEGWCAGAGSHGMDTPAAYQRRQPAKPPKKDGDRKPKPGDGAADDEEAA